MSDWIRAGLEQEMKAFAIGSMIAVVFVPLGVWKAVEIIIWIVKHVSIEVAR